MDPARTSDPVETLVIELADDGHTSFGRSVTTTLLGPCGLQWWRFLARSHRGEVVATSEAFPMLPLQLAPGPPLPDAGWPDEVHAAHVELTRVLADQGWRLAGTGDQWWSQTYTRPAAGPLRAAGAAGSTGARETPPPTDAPGHR